MNAASSTTAAPRERVSLPELAWVFLRLGTVAFGGPAAHIALFREEVVIRRKWLSEAEFLDLLGAVNLIPGPNSTEMVIHLGHRRAGWRGLVLAGLCFILPAALISGILAFLYVRMGRLPEVEGLLYGVKPVIIAIILKALWGLGRTALKTRTLAALALAAAGLNWAGVNELLVLLMAGLAAVSLESFQSRSGLAAYGLPAIPLLTSVPAAVVPIGLWPLFLFFLKVGAVLFGSGYVLIAFLRADLVDRWGWITETELLDAVAVGQITPGPLLSTATFIGYLVGGTAGAAVSTVGVFLPAFVFVLLSRPLIPRLRESATVGACLDGVNVAALALMGVVTVQLGRAALVDPLSLLIGGVASALLLRRGCSPTLLILAGAAAGSAWRLIGPA